ncbi:MAG: phage minor capsid protein [Dysosmobacter sp.]|nr:phage minor capsid protein [Dysosmobacter sp.]
MARSGFVEEAKAEKRKIDSFFGENETDCIQLNGRGQANKIIKEAYELGTGLLIMNVHGCACHECAKYQGRVFSIYGKDQRFPPLPKAFYEFGAIHKGCTHSFFPFIDGVSDPDLDYTLSIQKIKSWRYSRNILAFSNRPFVDDRPQEDIDEANRIIEERRIAAEKKKYAEDHMIEAEAKRGVAKREYRWIQENLSGICPKSFSGYMRMKNANTKNYQKIVAEAKKLGRVIE